MQDSLFRHRTHALGQEKADLILTNCNLVNVLSGRIERDANIAISGSHIVGIGNYRGRTEYDCRGQFVYPGLIDAHIHLESSKLTIPECARIMSRNGTTSVITDPHEIANVASIEGISYQLDSAADNERMSVYFTVPSCVPAIPDPEIETFAAQMGATKLRTFFNNPWFVVLGEMMNMPGAIYGDEKVLEKIRDYYEKGTPIDGHAPGLKGKELNTYIYLGMRSDHESTSAAEAQEKLDRGMYIMIREGSTESNLHDVLPIVNLNNSQRIMFASDDLDPIDLEERGHINFILKEAVSQGLDPITALQMATINPANYFRRSSIGAIFPGAWADLVISPDLKDFFPTSVMRGGKWVFHEGQEIPVGKEHDRFMRSMMNVNLPSREDIRLLSAIDQKVRVVSIIENQIVTQEEIVTLKSGDGQLLPDVEKDIAKICVFERHRNSGSFAVGFIKGLGLKCGAIGSTVAHDSHNIIVAGMDDASIITAARKIEEMNGGQIAVCNQHSAAIPLPIAGLMSDRTFEEVVAEERAFHDFCHDVLKTKLKRPASTLSFMALPVIPTLKITDKGLFKIEGGNYPQKVPVIVD